MYAFYTLLLSFRSRPRKGRMTWYDRRPRLSRPARDALFATSRHLHQMQAACQVGRRRMYAFYTLLLRPRSHPCKGRMTWYDRRPRLSRPARDALYPNTHPHKSLSYHCMPVS